jgi:hypothetical protein
MRASFCKPVQDNSGSLTDPENRTKISNAREFLIPD